jgi:ribosome biogenesis GTPase
MIISRTSGYADVLTPAGILTCRVRGKLKQGLAKTDIIVIGDQVSLRMGERGEPLIDSVEPRRTRLSRRHPAQGRVVEDVLVANLDVALVCVARGSQSLRAGVLDRFLVLAEAGDVAATIVISKADLPEAPDEPELVALYRSLGYPVIHASTRGEPGIEVLRASIDGRLAALVGPSGVGKSSLANQLVPGIDLDVGEVDDATSRGKHTTRLARLVQLPTGGYLADTPGVRELATFGVPTAELDGLFREIRARRGDCRFRNCRHDAEPGCAVRNAVAMGDIAASRHASYLRMLHGDERNEE